MALFLLFLYRSQKSTTLAILTAVITGAVSTALIVLINMIITNNGRTSKTVIVIFISLCASRLFAGVVSQYLLIRLSQDAIRELRVQLCRQVIATPLAELEKVGPARLIAAFSDDMLSIANVVVNLPYACVNLIIVAGCLLYLGWLSWHILLGLSVCMMIGASSYLIPVTLANNRLRMARAAQDRLFTHFRALIQGIKELCVHSARRHSFLSDVLIPAADEVRRHSVSGITIYSFAANWNRLLFFIYVGILLFGVPVAAPVKIPSLAGYILVLLYMMAPLEAIMNVIPLFAQANVALKQIATLGLSLADGSPTLYLPSVSTPPGTWNRLELQQVTYAYDMKNDSHAFILGPIDLSLSHGELLFIIGGNGSGKTTLLKLLSGLYVPSSGQIVLNGQPIDANNRDNYRQLFAVVFSDFFLFDSLLGLNNADINDRTTSYLSRLQLQSSVQYDNGTFSTLSLSQGQRKRLALLVAILEQRPIYVLDEWAADQDPHFKKIFYMEILPELRKRGDTIIVISHDDHYYHLADRVLKLDDGKLVPV